VVDAIAGEPLIAEDQFQIRQLGLQVRLQPSVVLHAIGERIADEDNVVARLECERRGSTGRREDQRRSESPDQGESVPASSGHGFS